MRNDKYVRILHRRRLLQELEAIIRDRFLFTGGVEKVPLICEEAPYIDREVSQDAIIDVLGWIDLLHKEETKKLERFELREREDITLPPTIVEQPKGKDVKGKNRKSQSEHGGSNPAPCATPDPPPEQSVTEPDASAPQPGEPSPPSGAPTPTSGEAAPESGEGIQ